MIGKALKDISFYDKHPDKKEVIHEGECFDILDMFEGTLVEIRYKGRNRIIVNENIQVIFEDLDAVIA